MRRQSLNLAYIMNKMVIFDQILHEHFCRFACVHFDEKRVGFQCRKSKFNEVAYEYVFCEKNEYN